MMKNTFGPPTHNTQMQVFATNILQMLVRVLINTTGLNESQVTDTLILFFQCIKLSLHVNLHGCFQNILTIRKAECCNEKLLMNIPF
jgi:hypothetical protein